MRNIRRKNKYIWSIVGILFVLVILGATNQAEEVENGLEIEITAKQTEGDTGKNIEVQFHVENTGQVPISNLILYSESQNYVTRIAMLQPGEGQVFTKGESSKLLFQVTSQDQSYQEVNLYAEGVIKKGEESIHISDQKTKKIRIQK